jgi:integrase
MLVNERLTEKAIKRLVEQRPDFSCLATTLRDTENRYLQLRFHTSGVKASWRILFKNKWVKVGEWPEVSVKAMRDQFTELLNAIRANNTRSVIVDELLLCADVFTWCLERLEDNAHIASQTRKDIKSAINCHLKPKLHALEISSLDKNRLDKHLIWPLQKELAVSSVGKVFRILKRIFRDAADLNRIKLNPLADIKISDFNITNDTIKEHKLKPRHVAQVLSDLSNQAPLVKVLIMTMLTLGTRIGETLQAKWLDVGFVDPCVWDIPAATTKTKKPHSIYLPKVYVQLLQAWRIYLAGSHYKGQWLFPNKEGSGPLLYNDAALLINDFSNAAFSGHDLRRCARSCWVKQKVDYMVGERMLNHSLGKAAEAYLGDDAQELRLVALENHCAWLLEQNGYCFFLNPAPTLAQNDALFNTSENKC